MTIRILTILLLLTTALPSQDGLYADFTITGGVTGTFTCRLDHQRAPRTVANFLALAAGTRRWLDLTSGDTRLRPYYDGLTFHRVVPSFVIQAGSPNGNGTDGPGYTFRDEFHPDLHHDKAGILSMANSGLHSNGSQFFITLAPAPHLDGVHSIFGEVTAGMSTVNAIGAVATGPTGKPLTPVIIQAVAIRRVGPAALAFDEHAHGLPSVGGAAPRLLKNGSTLTLQFPRALGSEYILFHGPTIATPHRFNLGIYTRTVPPDTTDVTATPAGSPAYYYRVAQIAYPDTLHTPLSLAGSTITMTTSAGTITYVFNANLTAGTCTYGTGAPGAVYALDWVQEAYRGRFYAQQTNIVPIRVDLAFTGPGGGILKGTAETSPTATPLTGTFTYTQP